MSNETDRARLALGILDNPLFEEALQMLREAYLKAATACGPSEDKARWRYIVAIENVRLFREHLQAVLQTGNIAQEQLNQMREIEKRENILTRVVRGFYSDDASAENAA